MQAAAMVQTSWRHGGKKLRLGLPGEKPEMVLVFPLRQPIIGPYRMR
jgi:hypothetical protein